MAGIGSELPKVDPELRRAALTLPGGYALHRGLGLPRILMNLAGLARHCSGFMVAAR